MGPGIGHTILLNGHTSLNYRPYDDIVAAWSLSG
jgi:hypothetical protein